MSLRGGSLVTRGEEPEGTVLSRMVAVGCVDRAGQPTQALVEEAYWLLQPDDDEVLLVVSRPGFDSWVLRPNATTANHPRVDVESHSLVFQLSMDSGPGGDLLRHGASRRCRTDGQ